MLHVSQPAEAGVASVLLSYLARPELGLTQVVACPSGSLLADEVRRLGHEHLGWESSRGPGRSVLAEARDLQSIVRRVDPDVVHLHSSKAGLVGRIMLRGSVTTVFQPHAWSFSAVGGVTRALSLQWERSAQRWTHATVCVSRDEQHRGEEQGVLRRGHPTRAGIVWPNAVDPVAWPAGDRVAARSHLGLPADAPLAVCVGRLCRQKGQDLLLSAWPQVVREVRSAARTGSQEPQLVLVGDGPDRGALERALPPGVRLVGAADPHPWYAAADVAVVPSRWEAMAMVPLEAQASGRLVVAADVDGMREQLHLDHLVVPAERPDALAHALIQALSDLPAAARIGASARQLAQRQWSAHRHGSGLHTIYAAAVDAAHSRASGTAQETG